MVYVLSKDNKPLMPCENVVARLLLKSGKAKVKRKCPFIIKLNIDSTTLLLDRRGHSDFVPREISEQGIAKSIPFFYTAEKNSNGRIFKSHI